MPSYIGTGTTVVFGTSGFTGDLLDVSWGGISLEEFETSHMSTVDTHTFKPKALKNPGEITLQLAFDPDEEPPILDNGAIETITIDWGGLGTTWSVSGFQTAFDISAPLEDKMTCTATFKCTSDITVT
jgi:hypothetical protein